MGQKYDELFSYDYKDKADCINNYMKQMFLRTSQMFIYKDLPSTIPANILEYYLQMGGSCGIAEVDGKLYALKGGWGGKPDAYNRGTKYTVANAALNLSKEYELGKDCVLAFNDSMYMGLKGIFTRYASALVENDITMRIADIQARVPAIMTAGDDRTRASVEKFLEKIIKGDISAVISDNAIMETFKAYPYTNTATKSITDLIELHQYLKAGWFNEIGLSANYNMKREAINSQEAQLGEDALLPLVDDMLHSRQKWVAEVNALFGTHISVDYHSAWEHLLDDEGGADDEQSKENSNPAEDKTDAAEQTLETTSNVEEPADKGTEPEAGEPADGKTDEGDGKEAETEKEANSEEEQKKDQLEQDFEIDKERQVESNEKIMEVPVIDKEVEEAETSEKVEETEEKPEEPSEEPEAPKEEVKDDEHKD